MSIIDRLEAAAVGKTLVGIESEHNDYPFFRRNVLVFDDGTRVVVRSGSGDVKLRISPGPRGATVVEGTTVW